MSRHWHDLSNDQTLWKSLCCENQWEWKNPLRNPTLFDHPDHRPSSDDPFHVDEGVGEDETVASSWSPLGDIPTRSSEHSTSTAEIVASPVFEARSPLSRKQLTRQSAPAVLPSPMPFPFPNYKLLFQTRTILKHRLRNSAFRFTTLPGVPTTPHPTASHAIPLGHTSTIYSLCLLPAPETSIPTLFTASRDLSILQWDLSSSTMSFPSPVKVFRGAHTGSVLSICVAAVHGWLISGGSDGRVVIWSLKTGLPVKILQGIDGHSDSVLCVRCDAKRIVSCSKGLAFSL